MKARFKPGDRVRVRVDTPPPHCRTPAYIQGKTGWVAAVHGIFRNPETLALGGDGLPELVLYLVRFPQTELWAGYAASPQDQLFIDLYEHWLAPA